MAYVLSLFLCPTVEGHWACPITSLNLAHRRAARAGGRVGLAVQVVFVQLVVDAAGGDPEEPRGVRLIAVRLVQRGFEQ